MKNITFDEINLGDTSSFTKKITQDDINGFANIVGDNNPVHLSKDFAEASQFGGIVAHGMFTASFISTVLGTQYPGPGTVFLGLNNVKFLAPVKPGDTITTTLEVSNKHASKPIVTFGCKCINQDGTEVLTAEAVALAPKVSIDAPDIKP